MTDRLEVKAEVAIDAEGTLTGIAWPFGAPDSVGDVIDRGAFSFPADLPMVMEHDQSKVVGIWKSFSETDAGLEVKGRLFVEGVGPARTAHRDLKAGTIAGLSIGFRHDGFEPRPGGRVFKSITVTEISLCKRPVHPGARVTIVKSHSEETNVDPQTAPETKSDPVIGKADLDALKADVSARLDRIEAKAQRIASDNPPAGENDNSEVKAFASFLRGPDALGIDERKALTVANDAPGFILAPEDRSSEFLRNLVEFSPVRAVADVRTTGSHTVLLPKRTAVTNAKWKGEATASDPSEPTFDQMEIAIKEMNTHVDISNWMIEDAVHDVEAEVRLALAEDFGAKEGVAFVGGSATLEPKGFMADAGIAHTANGHATNLSADALIDLMYRLPATFRNRGTWAMNGTTLATVRKLKDGAGNYLWQPAYMAGQPETILGRPVIELVDMPDLAANAFPIIFGDFKSGYRIYDRIELAVRPNPYLLATEGLVRFHARRRVGAGVVRSDAFRKLKMAAAA